MPEIEWLRVVSYVAVVLLIYTASGYLKVKGGWRTGDTRKINHTATLVLGVLWFLTLPLDRARPTFWVAGTVLALAISAVCWARGRGGSRYIFAGYAREKDAPHEAFHIWFSFVVALTAILLIDVVFQDRFILAMAVLLLGIGDAMGEPIGIRFGRHRYTVSGILTAEPSVRTLEGSGGVLAASFIAACAGLWLFGGVTSPVTMIAVAALLAGCVTGVEAYSPHGLDNFTIPLVAALVMRGVYAFI